MTASPAIKRLGAALRNVTDNGDPGKVVALAREWGINGRCARRAAQNIDIDASSYLKLCGAIGIDPVTGEQRDFQRVEDIDLNRLAIKIMLALIERDQTMRKTAKSWGISLVILARAKAQQPVNIVNFLRICAGLKCHPHEFTKQIPQEFHMKQSPEQPEQVTA